MIFNLEPVFFLSGLILFIASIDDLRSRKIHNKLILVLLFIAILAVFVLKGSQGLIDGGLSAGLALLVAVPLALLRAIGGGDLKLLVVLAFTLSWLDFLRIFIYSLPWALLLGLVKITLDGQLKKFFLNLYYLFTNRTTKGIQFHSIPFSVTLFMAWMSWLTLKSLGYY